MPSWILSILPPLTVVLAVVLTVAVFGWAFRHRWAGVSGRAVHRQALVVLVLFIGLLALVVTLPVPDSTRSDLLSLIGLLVSAAIALASTTFVGNAMAGILLHVIRSYRPGDFISVGEQFGRVSEQGLLHTEIQTEDRDLITLPNLYLVNQPVRVTHSSGTVVSADVSLGYDVHHGEIEAVLLEAALAAGLGEPFIRILELGDYSVSYRVAGMLTDVKHLVTARSRLRSAMLDHLHNAGIEIVSPSFMNQRVLVSERAIIPPVEREPYELMSDDEIFPEMRVFDKAERAESLGKMSKIFVELGLKLNDLEKRDIESLGEPERVKLQQRILKTKDMRERLKRRIEEIEAQRG